MYRVGIVSKPGRDLSCVRSDLSASSYFRLLTYTDAGQAVMALKEKSLQALVIILDRFSESQFQIVEKIRHFQPNLPIAFVAKEANPITQKQVLELSKSIVISFSERDDLPGILMRMLKGQKVFNRKSVRQKTLQTATITASGAEALEHGCVLDLAGLGARIRTFKNAFKKGDRIRLNIPLTFLRKTYVVDAEVVWCRDEAVTPSHPTHSNLLGLRFLQVYG